MRNLNLIRNKVVWHLTLHQKEKKMLRINLDDYFYLSENKLHFEFQT